MNTDTIEFADIDFNKLVKRFPNWRELSKKTINPDFYGKISFGEPDDLNTKEYDPVLCPSCHSRVINSESDGYVTYCHRCGYEGPENAKRHKENKPGYILVFYPWHAPGALMKEYLEECSAGSDPDL
jgi:ribosomal protein L37AE/L43A